MASRICQFAKKRTDIKIIKFGPQSEFCKSLIRILIHHRDTGAQRKQKQKIVRVSLLNGIAKLPSDKIASPC
jgi:hypothetical protein